MLALFQFIDDLKKVVNSIDEKVFGGYLSVKLDCKSLLSLEERGSMHIVLKDFFTPLDNVKQPVLYWFEIVSSHSAKDIIASAKSAARRIKRKFPVLNQVSGKDTDRKILYVGKTFGISGRMIAHLGYDQKEDHHGLQLCHWAREMGLQLQLNYLIVPARLSALLDFFEAQLAKQLNPIIGKRRF